MKFLDIKPDTAIKLNTPEELPELVHVFEKKAIQAVNTALAAGRPLLLRGEPGIGKSQMARAVAKGLGWAFVPFVVDAQGESRDLLWHFDAVARLAEAQLLGALGVNEEKARQRLAVANYLRPGPLWWAFDWTDAEEQAGRIGMEPPPQRDGGDPQAGRVVLIDEIDKAETDLPNGLLEALGAGEFTPTGRAAPVLAGSPAPLVMISTNEERALPDAFLRRCLVLHLTLPEDEEDLKNHLLQRGRAHFPQADEGVLKETARQVAEDRGLAREKQWQPLPGQAEYLDLLRALQKLAPADAKRQGDLLTEIAGFALKKQMEGP